MEMMPSQPANSALENGYTDASAKSGSGLPGPKNKYPNGTTAASIWEDFQPISLAETNERAQMLSRIDKKYVVNLEQCESLLQVLDKTKYAVLEIDDVRQFSYTSCYYDDDFKCYYAHHQGRRQRFKARTREYVDTGGKYFEVKLKGLRGVTVKHRLLCDFLVTPQLGGEQLEMLCDHYLERYKSPMCLNLRPALVVGYKRSTLVALKGGERVTVDYGLSFSHPDAESAPIRIGHDFIIVETKSGNGDGEVDQALRAMSIRTASKCSKYCIGVSLTNHKVRNNHFLPTIRQVSRNIVRNGSSFGNRMKVKTALSPEGVS